MQADFEMDQIEERLGGRLDLQACKHRSFFKEQPELLEAWEKEELYLGSEVRPTREVQDLQSKVLPVDQHHLLGQTRWAPQVATAKEAKHNAIHELPEEREPVTTKQASDDDDCGATEVEYLNDFVSSRDTSASFADSDVGPLEYTPDSGTPKSDAQLACKPLPLPPVAVRASSWVFEVAALGAAYTLESLIAIAYSIVVHSFRLLKGAFEQR